MLNDTVKHRLWRWFPPVTSGAMLALASGCDDSVRQTLLTGIQSATLSLVQAVVNAFFESLLNDSQTQKALVDAVSQVWSVFAA